MAFYIYTAHLRGELVYIGKGKGNRYKHITSGKSHSHDINEAYFRHKLLGEELPLVNIIAHYEDEDDCLEAEELAIRTCKPIWNKEYIQSIVVTEEAKKARLEGHKKWRENYKPSEATLNNLKDARDKRLQLTVSILVDKKNKVAKMPEILKAHGVTNMTFCRYKNEFSVELKEMNLIK